jgi:hypothetical protein
MSTLILIYRGRYDYRVSSALGTHLAPIGL